MTTISQDTLTLAQAALANNDVTGAWEELREGGDTYASAAAALTNDNTSFLGYVVQKYWDRVFGIGVRDEKWDVVAKTHLTNYINEIQANPDSVDPTQFALPNTQFIEESYASALETNGLSRDGAIDLAINQITQPLTISLDEYIDRFTPGASKVGLDLTIDMPDWSSVLGLIYGDFGSREIPNSGNFTESEWEKALFDLGVSGLTGALEYVLDGTIAEDIPDYVLESLEGLHADAIYNLAKDYSWAFNNKGAVLDQLIIELNDLSDQYGWTKIFDTATEFTLNVTQQFLAFLSQFEAIRVRIDPLVVDLDKNGFFGTVRESVYFDLDSDGFAELTQDWMTPGDGMIVWDINDNNRADNGIEIFGESAQNAWAKLAEQDDNADNIIDANDTIWTQLHIWQDANSDGFTQADEWFDLADLDITQINIPPSGFFGNAVQTSGSFQVRAVNIDTDPRNTRFAGDVDFKFETLFLPEIRGFNALADLRIGMSLDSTLLTDTQALSAQSISDVFENSVLFRNDFTNMMFKWAGVDGIAANSRGEFISDARILEFLEVYFGAGFFQARFPEANPLSLAANAIESVFNGLRQDMIDKFIYQMGGNTVFATTGAYDLATDTIQFESGAPILSVDGLNDLGTAGASSADALAYWAGIARFIDGIRGGLENFTTAELNALNAAIALSDALLTWDDVKAARFDTGAVVLDGDAQDNFLVGGAGDDTLTGNDGNDTLQGNAGNDVLIGGEGDDALQGGAGDDDIQGGNGADTLRDGSGSDLIQGGQGDDTYFWEGGEEDFIFDEGGYDVIRVNNPANIEFERVFGTDLRLRDGLNNVTLQDQLADPSLGLPTIEEIQDINGNTVVDFSNFDGTVITSGTDNDDTILGIEFGGSQNDDIRGLDGNDILLGGAGDDIIDGGSGEDDIQGGAQNDFLRGRDGNDNISGGTGSDTLVGDDGNDFLDSGLGDDALVSGGRGNDTYYYTGGHDTYNDEFVGGQTFGNDRILVSDTFTLADAEIFRQYLGGSSGAFSLTIKFDDNNSILISNQQSGGAVIETLEFEDGSGTVDLKGSFTTFGTEGEDSIAGQRHNIDDTIFAFDGDDFIVDSNANNSFENGDDFIDAGAGDDFIRISDGTDTVVAGEGDDIIEDRLLGNTWKGNNFDGGSGSDTVDYIGIVTPNILVNLELGFSKNNNGSTVQDTFTSIENVRTLGGNDTLIGSTADNLLDGDRGNDTFEGGLGNDTYVVGRDNDTITDIGGIDSLKFEFTNSDEFEDLTVTQSGDDLIINTGTFGNETIIDYFNGNEIEFFTLEFFNQNGVENISTQIEISKFLNITSGTTASETVNGSALDDTILGRGGPDALNGFEGDDVIIGGSDTNIIEGGMGNDTIIGGRRNDFINGGEGDDYIIDVKSVTFSAVINGGAGNDTIISDINVNGDEGNDILIGTASGSTLRGGEGNDILDAGARIGGIGNSNIHDNLFGDDGDDIIITSGGNFRNFYSGGAGVDMIDYSREEARLNLFSDRAFHGATGFQDTLADIENAIGTDFDDIFNGWSEDNHFIGGKGNDRFIASLGNDLLEGGEGVDTYEFDSLSTDYDTTIVETGDDIDIIKITDASITSSDVVITDVGDDTEITFIGNVNSKITILDQNLAGAGKFELLQFADGSVTELAPLPANILPVAQDDTIIGAEGEVVTGNVLDDNGNGVDSDPDGDTLTVTAQTIATAGGGTAEIQEDGSFIYTAAEGFFGADSFDYTITDVRGDSDTATVTLNIQELPSRPPVAQNDSFTSEQDQELTGNVLDDNGNGVDSDGDGDTLSVGAFSSGTLQGGVVVMSEDGSFTYTPPSGFTGQDSFSYTVLDGTGNADTAVVSVTVEAPNDAPVAQDDSFAGLIDQNIIGNLLNDNGNGVDSDPEGDALNVFAETRSTAQGGNVTIQSNGDFTYTPAAAFSGQDSFEYILLDSNGNSSLGTVSLSVDSVLPPVVGTPDDDVLTGTSVDDTIDGLAGDDVIDGAAGDDTLIGGAGNDTITGGLGTDTADYSGSRFRTIIDLDAGTAEDGEGGTDSLSGIENIIGTDLADDITGDSNANDLQGGIGNDWIFGGSGDDNIVGGQGSDNLDGEGGSDTLAGNEGDDSFTYTLSENASNTDNYDGDAGIDRINLHFTAAEYTAAVQSDIASYLTFVSQNYNDTSSTGSSYNFTEFDLTLSDFEEIDVYVDGVLDTSYFNVVDALAGSVTTDGTAGRDIINGNAENETLKGFEEGDVIHGVDGADSIFGQQGNDTIHGGEGDDTLFGDGAFTATYGGNDIIFADGGNDRVNARAGDDLVYGGSGNDVLYGHEGEDRVYGEDGDDAIFGDVNFNDGIDFNDVLYGGLGNDTINGLGGHDTIYGGEGNDFLKGQQGDDYIEGGLGNDNIEGGEGNDLVRGGEGNDDVKGGLGDDIIMGEGGADILRSQGGNDMMYGGAGNRQL